MENQWPRTWLPDEEPEEVLSLADLARIGIVLTLFVLAAGIYGGCVEDDDRVPATAASTNPFGARKAL